MCVIFLCCTLGAHQQLIPIKSHSQYKRQPLISSIGVSQHSRASFITLQSFKWGRMWCPSTSGCDVHSVAYAKRSTACTVLNGTRHANQYRVSVINSIRNKSRYISSAHSHEPLPSPSIQSHYKRTGRSASDIIQKLKIVFTGIAIETIDVTGFTFFLNDFNSFSLKMLKFSTVYVCIVILLLFFNAGASPIDLTKVNFDFGI